MTKRRLLNKKAYEEMELLQKFLVEQGNERDKFELRVILNKQGKEYFEIEHYDKGFTVAKVSGENYTAISKAIIEYLNEL